jgi:hypothetical protein
MGFGFKCYLRETLRESVYWIHLALDKDWWWALVNWYWAFGFHKKRGIAIS